MQEQEQRQQELREKLIQEQRQREMREKMADAQIRNAQGIHNREALFGPVEDYVEKRRSITRLFFSIYDNLGSLIAVSFFTFVPTLPLIYVLLTMNAVAHGRHPKPIGPLVPFLLVGLLAPPAWAAASSYCSRVVEDQSHALSEFWSDYRRLFGKSLVLAVGELFIGAALVYATGWYIGQRALPLRMIGIVSLYMVFFWGLISLYVWPLMVRGYRWRAVVRNALVLVAAAPFRAIGILLVLVIVSIILGISVVGVPLLLFGLWAMLPNQALILTRERLEKRAQERAAPST